VYMSLQQQIKENIKQAMLAKEPIKLEVLRGMSTAFMNELVAKGRKPQDELTDEEAQAVITRIGKQRKDSIEQFEKAGRADLADEEKAQYAFIEEYLPQLMSEEEINAYINTKKAEGLDTTQKGLVMKTLMQDLKGKADGQLVKKIIDAL
jgi:uncharacterized protein YqeY